MNRIVVNGYFALPTWLQNLVVSAYGLQLRRLRYGREHRQALQQLRLSQWLPAEALEQLQLHRLNEVLANARTTVPFYADRLPAKPLQTLAALSAVPILSKSEIRQAGITMVSAAFPRQALEIVHTGGTTGSPLSIYCNRSILQRNYAFFYRFREWAGVPPDARVATFAGRTIVPPAQSRPPYWRHNYASHALLCSSYHIGPGTVASYAQALARFRPALIDSYPSSIEPIARYVREHDIRIRPTAVITSSETLAPETRSLVEHAFGCPVFDHYGAAEMAAFVTQCEAGKYHVNSEFGIVEILRDGKPVKPGEIGEIVATGLLNPVMPLIRYATGDMAVLGTAGCTCGRAFPVIDHIVGRADDVLITPEGRRIGRLDPIFKAVSGLVETRIVQDRIDHVRVETVADQPLAPAEEATLIRELQTRLGPSMMIDIVRVARIERAKSGKFRSVVNLVTQPDRQQDVGLS